MFYFADIFSGIGGFHQGCYKNGGRCIIACDIDPIAREIYRQNYGVLPHNDVKTLKPTASIDLVCAGFPCQPYSLLGKRIGSKDPRGYVLFKHLLRYIRRSHPKCFLLENVRGIVSSDGGSYFKTIITKLEQLGYHISWELLNSKNFGLPQSRERIYIVGSLQNKFDFSRLVYHKKTCILSKILDKNPDFELLKTNRFEDVVVNEKKTYESGFVLRAKINNYTDMKLFSSDGIIGTLATGSPPVIYDERFRPLKLLNRRKIFVIRS